MSAPMSASAARHILSSTNRKNTHTRMIADACTHHVCPFAQSTHLFKRCNREPLLWPTPITGTPEGTIQAWLLLLRISCKAGGRTRASAQAAVSKRVP